MIGQTVSHYRIVEKLGAGGMGVVYKAHDTKLDRVVALKFLPHQTGPTREQKARFLHEARSISALDHANICTIYVIDETDDGQMFIAMGYYAGESLAELLLPVETSVKPMLAWMGAPEKDKKLFLFDGDHIPRANEVVRVTLDWLDRYLGVPH